MLKTICSLYNTFICT